MGPSGSKEHNSLSAKAKTDAGYIEYKNSMEDIFRTALKRDTGVFSVSKIKQTLGTVEYDRMIARQPGRIATVCMTIQDGRCVSYWYVGTTDSWDAFTSLLGKATYKAD